MRIPESTLGSVDVHPLLPKQKEIIRVAGGNGGGGPMGWQHVQVQALLLERSASGAAREGFENQLGDIVLNT